ncbi:MAG: cadherin-like beta sandwich domain-containing protein [Clostridia bacterium]|nr:cadherin-like beta sandwich domain-containing protein [Clostridia bacterium]
MAVGCTTLNATPVADEQPATNSASSISLELSSNHLLPGETIDLIITAKLKNDGSNANDMWGAADFYISSNIANKLEIVNVNSADEKFNKGTFDISGDFALESRYNPSLIVDNSADDFLRFSMPAVSEDKCISAKENLVIKIRLKLATDVAKGENLTLSIKDSSINELTTWGKDNPAYNGGGKGLDLSNAIVSAEIRDPDANTEIDYANVIEGKLDGTEGGDKPTKFKKPITFETVDGRKVGEFITDKESKDNFYVEVKPLIAGTTVDVSISGTACPKVSGYDYTYKVQLNGGNAGKTPVTIRLTSESGVVETYTLNVTQKYLGLGKLEATTNETVTVDSDKKGLSKDTPIEEGRKNFDILVPMSKDSSNGLITGSATQVTLSPSIITGYGINSDINISASNCTIQNGATQVVSGGQFIVTNINNNATITMTLTNSTGGSDTFTINLVAVGIDTSIDGTFNLLSDTDDKAPIKEADKVGGVDYTFRLPKESKYKALLGADQINLEDGATFKVFLGSTEVAKNADEAYMLESGTSSNKYTLRIISAAGNSKDYSLEVAREILPGAIVSFEYSIVDGSWIKVFDKNGVNTDPSITEFEYKEATKYFKLNASINTTTVKFRLAITDSSTLTGFDGSGSSITGSGQYLDYETFEYSYNDLKRGVNTKIITVNSSAGTGSSAYHIDVVITESDFAITNIQFGKDSDKDDYIQFKPDTLTYAFTVPYKTHELNLDVDAQGVSTLVYVNDVQLDRTQDTANVTSHHNKVIALRSATTTTFKITYKGTDGIVDGTKTYTITITRSAASAVNTLSTLEVFTNEDADEGARTNNILTGFNADNTTYFIELTSTTLTKLYINAVASADVATIDGSVGFIDLTGVSEAIYTFTIRVTPENSVYGSGIKTYTIRIKVKEQTMSNDNKMYDFNFVGNDGNTYLNLKDGDGPSHTIDVPYNVSSFKIFASHAENATLVLTLNGADFDTLTTTSNGMYALVTGNSTITAQVIAEDGSKGRTYTILVNRAAANTNATLSQLDITNNVGGSILKVESGKFNYKVNVSNGSISNRLVIRLATANPLATITVTENGENVTYIDSSSLDEIELVDIVGKVNFEILNMAYGTSRLFTITVVSDGVTQIYTVELTRASQAPVLESLEITKDGSTIADLLDKDGNKVEFSAEIFEYTVKVDYNVASINITGKVPAGMTPTSLNINQSIASLFGSDYGTKTITFSIKNGSLTQEYAIHVVRGQNPDKNVNITSITFGKIPTFVFDNNTNYQGSYVVKYAVTSLSPVVVPANTGATVSYKLNGDAVTAINGLKVGKNTIDIIVTANDGVTTRVITLEVVREEAEIRGINVANGENGQAIDTNITDLSNDSYSFSVANDIKNLDVKLQLEEGYTFNVSNAALEAGKMNKVTVDIKDSTGAVVRTLELNVYRDAAPADYTMWYIIAGVLGGLALILLIIAIIAFVKGGKGGSRRKGNINDIGIGDYELD